jgi:hypothetical protein
MSPEIESRQNQSLDRPFGHADPGDMFAWAGERLALCAISALLS